MRHMSPQRIKVWSTLDTLHTFILCTMLVGLFVLAGCGMPQQMSAPDRDSVDFGLVVTTAQDYDSRIMWFDKDLNLQSEQHLKYAMLGDTFTSPKDSEGKLYLIPQGLGDRKDTRKVISIDKETLTIEEYPFQNIALNDTAVIGEHVYAVNTLNGDSYLESFNVGTKESNTIKIDQIYMDPIIAAGDKLFTFSVQFDVTNPETPERQKVTMRVYSSELQLLKTIDISEYGIPTSKYLEDDTSLYVTVSYSAEDSPVSKILKINKQTYEIEEISLEEEYPFDIYQYDNKLLITHYDPVQISGSKVSFLDDEGKETYTDLGVPLTSTGIIGDKFVVANNSGIRLYSLPDFELLKEYELSIDERSYVSYVLMVDE